MVSISARVIGTTNTPPIVSAISDITVTEGEKIDSRERAMIENEAKTHEATLAECHAGRNRIVAALDNKGVIDTFQRIAKVRGTAVARAADERCTICQVRLRPAVFQEVRKNDAIVQCDSCQRILYYIAPPPPRPIQAP